MKAEKRYPGTAVPRTRIEGKRTVRLNGEMVTMFKVYVPDGDVIDYRGQYFAEIPDATDEQCLDAYREVESFKAEVAT